MDRQLLQRFLAFCCLGLLMLGFSGCGNSITPAVQGLIPVDHWQTLATEQVSLAIPPGYVGGSPDRELEAFQQMLLAWEFGDRQDWLAQNTDRIILLALAKVGDRLDSINVVQEKRPEGLSLSNYLQAQSEKLEAAGLTVATDIMADYGRLAFDSASLAQLSYVYPDESVFWVLTYSSGTPFSDEAAWIEQSQRSFKIYPESS